MRICRKKRERRIRTEPVHYGEKSKGKRALVRAVMEAGYGLRIAEEAVDAVIEIWKKALASGDRKVAAPLGFFKVRKTPKHLRKRRVVQFKNNKAGEKVLYTWTVYNDPLLVSWKADGEEYRKLLQALNPGVDINLLDPPRPKKPKPYQPPYPLVLPPAQIFRSAHSIPHPCVPSRTDIFRR